MTTTKIRLVALAWTLALAGCQAPKPATVTVVGLWPEQPPVVFKPFDLWSGGNYFIWPAMDSAQPTLRWETFPRPADLAADTNGVLAQVNGATYDLRIWDNRGGFPHTVVYARDALPAPSHQVEEALPRARRYFWTVRARFQCRGQTRVTEWSRLAAVRTSRTDLPTVLEAGPSTFPDARYYQFRIP